MIDLSKTFRGEVLKIETNEFTNNENEQIKYHNLHLLIDNDGQREAHQMNAGVATVEKFLRDGGKPGSVADITVVPKASKNRIRPGVKSLLPVKK